jgi:aryl-alcohol dehydrogenase-like predicted oxidoreductase
MESRILGRSGLEVSAIGMGCWAIGGPWRLVGDDGRSIPAGWGEVDDDESLRAIGAALDAGVTFFDTAANYGAGHSERVLGKALAGRRQEVVIATKFGYRVDEEARRVEGDGSKVRENLASDCEASLRRLGTDYIDLYQLHVGDYDVDEAKELRDGLEELVSEGKIRWYGWSTDDAGRAAVFSEGEHCAAIQFAYNVLSEKFAVRSLLESADVAGIARSPLAMAILTGKITPDTQFAEDDVRANLHLGEDPNACLLQVAEVMRDTLTVDGRTAAQGALAWILTSDPRIVPIPGARSAGQVAENAAALDRGPLSMDQMVRLEGLRAAYLDSVRAHYDPAHAAPTPADAADDEEN